MQEGSKKCSKCERRKSLDNYYIRNGRYIARCKACTTSAVRAYNATNSSRLHVAVPATKRCSCCKAEKAASEFARNRSRKGGLQSMCYACHRDRRYGLAPGQFDALLAQQASKCAICRNTCPRSFELSVDHDHATGRVRGLLCQNCNAALGMLKDDVGLLARAIEYLTREVT